MKDGLNLGDIIKGREDESRSFASAVERGRVSHAYLIVGEEGSGRRTLARHFAATLLCGEDDRPCGRCLSCQRVAAGSHPSIVNVTHEKPATLSVDEIRGQLVSTAAVKPLDGGYRIYIIPDSEKMTPQAQNALLKTLEEPPSYVVIFLLASSAESLLPTVLSRCERMDLKPLPDELIISHLTDHLGVRPYEAKVIAAYAQGNIGKAILAATDSEFKVRRERTLEMLKGLPDMDAGEIRDRVKELREDKGAIFGILDVIDMYFRDALYYKVTSDPDGLIFSDEIGAVRRTAEASTAKGLADITEAASLLRSRLVSNVNFDLAVELFLLTARENMNA